MRRPSSSTSAERQWLRTSTRIPSPPACPARLVPPERSVSGRPAARAPAIRAPTSAADAARTTACGVNTYGDASWAAATLRGMSVVTLAGSLTHEASSPARSGTR